MKKKLFRFIGIFWPETMGPGRNHEILLFLNLMEMIRIEILELVICTHAYKHELSGKSIEKADAHLENIKALVCELKSLDMPETESITYIDRKIAAISDELRELYHIRQHRNARP